MNLLLAPLLEKAADIIGRFIPDPIEAQKAQLEILKLADAKESRELTAIVELSKQQNDINLKQAESGTFFVSGARPAAMWVFNAALAWQFLLRPAIETIYIFYTGHAVPVPLPTLDNALWEMGFGLLGLAGLRSWDKKNGVAAR